MSDRPTSEHVVTQARKPSALTIPSLDGVRALAVTIVFVGHAGLPSQAPFGVTIFFFLSGYLITTLLRMEFERHGSVSLRAFYARRALRLFPPLYLVLGIACLLTALGLLGEHRLRLGAVLAQVFYLGNYQVLQSGWTGPDTGRPPGTANLWSLAVEEHFYLLFPLLYILLLRRRLSAGRQALVLVGLCAAVLAWRVVLVYGMDASFDRTFVGTDTRVDSILFGCLLAVWRNPFLDGAPSGSTETFWSRHWATVLAPACLVAILVSLRISDPRLAATVQYTVQGLALLPLFVLAVRHPHRGVFRLLNLRPVRFVGTLSYSIYIVHQIVIAAVQEHVQAPQIVRGLLYGAITLAVSLAVYLCVERPVARLRRALSRAEGRDGTRVPVPRRPLTADGGAVATRTRVGTAPEPLQP